MSTTMSQRFLLRQWGWTPRHAIYRRGIILRNRPITAAPSPAASFSTYFCTRQSKQTEPPKDKESTTNATKEYDHNSLFDDVEQPHFDADDLSSMPKNFGTNQYMDINEELRSRIRQILWQFRAPIRYAVAYGSGVFSQGNTTTSSGTKPQIDLLFGVTYTQHWHSLNIGEHRNHYSALGKFGSGVVSYVQDSIGAGVYFNPYVEMNGMMIKYGVVNLDTLCNDLSDWDTLYLAGRLQKPVKILRDDSRVRLANQANLLSAVRVALLMLPDTFTEVQLYSAIAGISYMGDPRMSFAENPHKVDNIVSNQLSNFRRLYSPLIETLPNIKFKHGGLGKESALHSTLLQDMDPVRRGNMVRRLPKSFRKKLYFQYQRKFQISRGEFLKMTGETDEQARESGKKGGIFEQRLAKDLAQDHEKKEVYIAIRNTVSWPSRSQSAKGFLTSGVFKSWRYMKEKFEKWREAKKTTTAESKDQPTEKPT